jgi:5-methylcytosine-specific restriction endonuclease McrA
MGNKKQDAAQQAVRVMLAKVGETIDKAALGTPASHLAGAKLKDRLFEEFDGKCVYCQKKIDNDYAADHISPINRTSLGLHSIANLVLACAKCNEVKGSKSLDEFLSESPKLDSAAVKKRLSQRSAPMPPLPTTEVLSRLAENLYVQVCNAVEIAYESALDTMGISSSSKAKPLSQPDYSEVAKQFPLDSLVESVTGDLLGIVVTYSLQGPKGKRIGYVGVRDISTGQVIHRAPSRMKLLRAPRPE